jgi:hypothetical protein
MPPEQPQQQSKIPRGSRCLLVFAMKNSQLMQGFRPEDREATLKMVRSAKLAGGDSEIDCLTHIGIESLVIIWDNVSSYYVTDIPIESMLVIPEIVPPKDMKLIQ